jgi:hypothetical protein
MKRSEFDGFGSFLFALVVGIFGAVLAMHWSVCEQDDRMCAFTGRDGGQTARSAASDQGDDANTSQAPRAYGARMGRKSQLEEIPGGRMVRPSIEEKP